MRRSRNLIPVLLVFFTITGWVSLRTGEDDLQESLLREAAIIVAKTKYSSYPQYDYKDMTLSFNEVDGLMELSVTMNKVRNNPKGRFYFSDISKELAIVAVEWAGGYDRNYVYSYSVIFAKRENQWVNITSGGYLNGHVKKMINLDGDGSDEIILKESTFNKSKNELGGKYRIAFLNQEGKYEAFSRTNLGSYRRENIDEALVDKTINLEFVKDGDHYIIESTLESDSEINVIKARFRWEGNELVFHNSGSKTHLEIKGKDIWVRDAPATGEVVMKLNDGDKCRILGKAGFEIIRGMADWWYHIEFEGETGWVFGSQSDLKQFKQLVDQNVNFWDFYRDGLRDDCQKRSSDGLFSDEPETGCIFKDISSTIFSITRNNEGGYNSESHKIRKVLDNDLVLVTVKTEAAGAALCTNHKTWPAWFTNTTWNMRLSTTLPGELDTLYRINDNNYLLFTHSMDFCGSEFGLKGMQSWSKWNVYLFDKSKNATFNEIQEIGKFEISSDEIMSKEEGEVFTDSLGIEYNFNYPDLTLVLKEYKRKVKGDTFLRMNDATSKITYYWNQQQMKFQK